MIEANIFWVYLTTCIIASMSPGPGMFAVLSCSLNHGTRKTLPLLLGIISGLMLISVLSTLGLSALLVSSKILYNLLTLFSGSYLCYIGWMSFKNNVKHPKSQEKRNKETPEVSTDDKAYSYTSGIVISSANPKTLLFFTAFFPSFISTEQAIIPQIVGLTFILVMSTFCILFVYAIIFSSLSKWVQAYFSYINKLVGITFIFLGLGSIIMKFMSWNSLSPQ